jgi:DNA primase
VALLGTKFTDEQCEILEKSGALDIIIATDNDDAGDKARNRIANRSNRIFNIHHIKPPNNDWGEMTPKDIKIVFEDLINIIKEKCCV